MAISAWDILTYNGSDWVNQKWVQGPLGIGTNGAPTAQLQVVGVSNSVQLLVQGNATQTVDIFQVQENNGTLLISVGNLGQTRLFLNDATQLGYPLRMNHNTSLTPTAGSFGTGIQFYGNGVAAPELADLTIIQTNVTAGQEAAYLALRTIQAGTAATEVLRCTELGSVSIGKQAVLATNATDGFLYLPTLAPGAGNSPTGVPSATGLTGKVAMVFDTSNNKLWVYNGAWKSVTLT